VSADAVRIGAVTQIERSETPAVEHLADLGEHLRTAIAGQYGNDAP
jgi:hypothetical protein